MTNHDSTHGVVVPREGQPTDWFAEWGKPWSVLDALKHARMLLARRGESDARIDAALARGVAPSRAVNPPEFQEATWGVDSVMRPCKSMAISEYAFRQWAKDVGIVLADGVTACLPQLDAATVKAGEPEDVRAWLDSRRNAGVTRTEDETGGQQK